jgi:hypothetical protein
MLTERGSVSSTCIQEDFDSNLITKISGKFGNIFIVELEKISPTRT